MSTLWLLAQRDLTRLQSASARRPQTLETAAEAGGSTRNDAASAACPAALAANTAAAFASGAEPTLSS